MPAQGRGGPSKRPVSVDAFVVDDSGAPEPPRQCPASVTHQYDVSATIKPMRRTDMCTEKEYKPKATEACVAAVKSMHDTLFPAWAQRTDPPILVFGLSVLEIGDKKKGAHLQTGVTVRLDETVPAKVEKRVTDYFASLLAPFTAGGYIKWQLRKVHIHTDPRFMFVWLLLQDARVACQPHHSQDGCVRLVPHLRVPEGRLQVLLVQGLSQRAGRRLPQALPARANDRRADDDTGKHAA